MKIPNSLPWKLDSIGRVENIHGCDIGEIYLQMEETYMINACNNFPKAIELLNKILSYYELDSEEYSDGEILDLIKPEIDEFLNSLENE